MTVVLTILVVLLVCAAVIAVELMQLFRAGRPAADLPLLKVEYAKQDVYRPMERLLGQHDGHFLKVHSGGDLEIEKRFEQSRRRVLRVYLQEFRRDFQQAWGVCRFLAPFSQDPNFGVNLIGQLLVFYRLYSYVQVRLLLQHCQPAELGLGDLLQTVRQVRQAAYETLTFVEDLAIQPAAS